VQRDMKYGGTWSWITLPLMQQNNALAHAQVYHCHYDAQIHWSCSFVLVQIKIVEDWAIWPEGPVRTRGCMVLAYPLLMMQH